MPDMLDLMLERVRERSPGGRSANEAATPRACRLLGVCLWGYIRFCILLIWPEPKWGFHAGVPGVQ